jgi:hypothetical protein
MQKKLLIQKMAKMSDNLQSCDYRKRLKNKGGRKDEIAS